MLFDERFWPGLADGSITVAFRRWKRPTVKTGGTLQSPAGLLGIDSVRQIAESEITPADAQRAGFASLAELLRILNSREGTLYRIDFRLIGPDPRIALRQQADLSPDDIADLKKRLARLDAASTDGP